MKSQKIGQVINFNFDKQNKMDKQTEKRLRKATIFQLFEADKEPKSSMFKRIATWIKGWFK